MQVDLFLFMQKSFGLLSIKSLMDYLMPKFGINNYSVL